MATIGTFKPAGNGELIGEIISLNVQAQGVRIIPEPVGSNPSAPTHRVMVGRAEIGAGWAKTTGDGRPYISIKLDDPSFAAPIHANLYEDGDTHTLVWTRPTRMAER